MRGSARLDALQVDGGSSGESPLGQAEQRRWGRCGFDGVHTFPCVRVYTAHVGTLLLGSRRAKGPKEKTPVAVSTPRARSVGP